MQLREHHLVNRIHKCTRTYTHVRTRSVEPFCRRANINITFCRPLRNENVVKHKINDFHVLLNIYLLTVSSDSSSKDISFCVIFRVTCKLIICIILFEQLTKKSRNAVRVSLQHVDRQEVCFHLYSREPIVYGIVM